ncbi:MAG: GYD domain-containing protein [Chloroflexi bacterium]|nr:GYD domain-containing protein [Chloroflexota bacterium]
MQEEPEGTGPPGEVEEPGTLYMFLARLTDEGQKLMSDDPQRLNRVSQEVRVPGTQLLARYALLGQYDFLLIVEARDHQAVARLSLELGARAGLHIETLPAIPIGLLSEREPEMATPWAAAEPEPTEP